MTLHEVVFIMHAKHRCCSRQCFNFEGHLFEDWNLRMSKKKMDHKKISGNTHTHTQYAHYHCVCDHSGSCLKLEAQPIVINMQYIITTPTSTEADHPHRLPVSQFAPFFSGVVKSWYNRLESGHSAAIATQPLDRYLPRSRTADWAASLLLQSAFTHKHPTQAHLQRYT